MKESLSLPVPAVCGFMRTWKQEKIFNPDDEAGAEDGLENEI